MAGGVAGGEGEGMRPARTSADGDGVRNGNGLGAAMDVMDRSGQDVEVEIGLDAATRTRARARFVARKPAQEPPKPPELGDPWCPLTVRARLQRMAEVFRRLPHDPDTRPGRERSCMPTPVREIFKDMPPDPMRVPVAQADYNAACLVLDDLVKRQSRLQRILVWSIAVKLPHREIAKQLCCSHTHAGKRVQQMLTILVAAWNGYGWKPDAADIERARELIHRNMR